jgi:hypothetical protein
MASTDFDPDQRSDGKAQGLSASLYGQHGIYFGLDDIDPTTDRNRLAVRTRVAFAQMHQRLPWPGYDPALDYEFTRFCINQGLGHPSPVAAERNDDTAYKEAGS